MAKLEMNKNTPLEFGLYSLGDHLLNPFKGEKVSYEQRINEMIEASKLACLLYTSPSPRDTERSRMPSSA
ncbi:hypothetical protein JMUB7556_28220 [Staphylococcus aureus]